jgi:endonuclease/exonuclease/phosphatase family metal-dependent hydrolase
MTRYRLRSLLLCLIAPLGAFAESSFRTDLPQISWEKAADHYGQECVVYGTVVAARDIGSRCFLNFHPNFREHFTVVVNSADYGKFPESPDAHYKGKHVRVVGKIIEYQGKPEIIVTGPEVIEIIDDPTPPAATAGTATHPADAGPAPAAAPTTDPSAPAAAAPRPMAVEGVVKIATFNVLNLFDDHDDPYVANDRVPGKDREEKAKLASAMRQIGADVVALQEVENRGTVQQFVDEHLRDFDYEVVHYSGNSDRGIDVALLSRLPVNEVVSHRHLDFQDANGRPMRFQRDLLQVRIAPEGFLPFDVFVVHLKSKHGGADASLPLRMGEARTIRMLLDRTLQHDSQARFVICGDFNDTTDSEPLRTIIGQGALALRGFVDELSEEKCITFNRTHLSMIDFILASPAMGPAYVPHSYDVLLGSVETHGSDHNPVSASFKLPRRGETH